MCICQLQRTRTLSGLPVTVGVTHRRTRPRMLYAAGLVCGLAGGCGFADTPPAADAPPSRVYPAPEYRIQGIALGGGDSLPLDGATSAALSGDWLAILQTGAGRVVVINLETRTYRILGRRGSGPSDVPPGSAWGDHIALSGNGFLAILDVLSGTVRVWDTAGAVRWVKRIGDASWGLAVDALERGSRVWSDGVGIDSVGRVYVPVAVWEGDSLSVMVMRMGPDHGDSAVTPRLATEGPVKIRLPGGRSGRFQHIIRLRSRSGAGALDRRCWRAGLFRERKPSPGGHGAARRHSGNLVSQTGDLRRVGAGGGACAGLTRELGRRPRYHIARCRTLAVRRGAATAVRGW